MNAKAAIGSHRNCNRGSPRAVNVVPVWIVSVAVAVPSALKGAGFGLNEQVGADCAGCTEQERVTGLLNKVSSDKPRCFQLARDQIRCSRTVRPGRKMGLQAPRNSSLLGTILCREGSKMAFFTIFMVLIGHFEYIVPCFHLASI